MKKLNNYIKIILLVVVISSCSSRKVTRTESKEAEKVEITDNTLIQKKEEVAVKVVEKTIVNDQNKTKIKETIYKPVDVTKEATVTTPDGKSHKLQNAEIIFKETDHQNNTKTENSRNSEQFHKQELSDLSESNIKADSSKDTAYVKVDREAWNYWNLLWLLVPIAVIYFAWTNRVAIGKKIAGIWWM